MVAGARILVVDDEKKIVELIAAYLLQSGYQVLTTPDGAQALDEARHMEPDLIILDLMLPGIDGLTICRMLRAEGNRTPIIMLTARALEEDKLLGLSLGADDYVTKPFSPRELVARVRAILRRVDGRKAESPAEVHQGDLTVDRTRHEVRVRGELVNLTAREFDLLETLIREPGRVFSRQELIDRAFGSGYDGLERTVDMHVLNLRRKIEPDPSQPTYVQTVPGVGYRFAEQPSARSPERRSCLTAS